MVEKEFIEREALIEHMKDLPTWWADSGGVYGQAMKYPEGMFDCDDVINSVDNAPAADVVEVRHGEWVKNEEESKKHVEVIYFCSACQNWEAWGETEKYNYCPNCGARMDGERKCKNG